jgi:adenylosuccinate lyase
MAAGLAAGARNNPVKMAPPVNKTPPQPTTVGKRACLWAYDLAMDLEDLQGQLGQLKARSTKGTTGTQASFLELFEGDHGKVTALEQRVAEKMGFAESYLVTGQTYSRKIDSRVLDLLSRISQSAHKAATDIRLLAHRKEVEEPFEKDQVGSSAMAYKRNPMRSERICALARFVISLQSSTAHTAATQWMERTLDDSANRRLVIPQSFLATDAILVLYENIAGGLVTYPQVMANHLRDELPFMATENSTCSNRISIPVPPTGKPACDLRPFYRDCPGLDSRSPVPVV